jgi:hypothetical protein
MYILALPGSMSIDKTVLKSRDGEQLLQPPMVELLTRRAECSLVALKSVHSSRLLPGAEDNRRFVLLTKQRRTLITTLYTCDSCPLG